MDAIADYPLHSSGLVNAPKVLADIVESTIGAIFIDSNSSIDTTWKVLLLLHHTSLPSLFTVVVDFWVVKNDNEERKSKNKKST